jgi:hypothetical protein
LALSNPSRDPYRDEQAAPLPHDEGRSFTVTPESTPAGEPQRRATVEWRPVERERLRVSRCVARSFADVERILRVSPERALQLAYGKAVDPNGAVISLSPYPSLPRLRVPVRVESSTPVGEHHGAVISIRWTATRMTHLFPVMEADLSIHPNGSEECKLILDGQYRPPLGLLGLILDRLVGRWVASTTARSFLDRLGNCIEQTSP